MDENDLANMMKNVSQMINDGNIPDELKNMLNNFKSSSNSSNNNSSTDNTSQFDTSSIDFNTILKMKSIFDKMNSSDDPRANLLRSLKPYLKESRKSKIDQYIQLLNMSKVLEIFKSTGGDDEK
jgi:hypothetical protein